MKNFKLRILTNDNNVFEGEVVQLVTEDNDGMIEILANHSSLISMIIPCKSRFQSENGEEKILFISKGILKIHNNEVEILCESSEFKEAIDIERAKKAKERAEKRLIEENENIDIKRAKAALLRAKIRLSISE